MATTWVAATASSNAESQKAHQWPVMHRLALLVGASLRLVPSGLRPSLARAAALLLRPVIARSGLGRQHAQMGIDTPREIALYAVLDAMTRAGCTFPLAVRHEGIVALRQALGSGRGVLIACPHALLIYAMLRAMADIGREPWFVATDQRLLLGSARLHRWIKGDRGARREVGRCLSGGEIVCAMIDRSEPAARTIPIHLTRRDVHVAPVLLDEAQATSASVVYCSARAERGQIVLTWQAADRATAKEFGAFIRQVAAH